MLFDELEVKVFVGDGAYTLYDEQGEIHFKMEPTNAEELNALNPKSADAICRRAKASLEDHILTITPSVDCLTKSITVKVNPGWKVDGDANITLNGEPVTVKILRVSE